MSDTIDRRVVEMRFDNKEFENNVQSTMTVLEKLKERLNFKGAEKSMGINGLSAAVDGVKDRFSAMEVVGMTALVNLTNSAVNLGKKLARSLTIDQVRAGFTEYELKMNSIQTIMASTGASVETVNGYLNELNNYSDRTIYSFSDMTQNIGKFTNAGVKLQDAVDAIRGISNEAAVSGANANEASRAMYNFAQALSAGHVKLIDWKSIENANMATVEFKQQLIDTAEAMGNLEKQSDGTYKVLTEGAGGRGFDEAISSTKNFNDSLSAAWMTTDVLTQTLKNYSVDLENMTEKERESWREQLKSIGYTEEQIDNIEILSKKAYAAAQDVKTFTQLVDTVKESIGSGWAQTFELLFGNIEEAKSLWTAVNNVVSDFVSTSSNARNTVLQTWKDLNDESNSFTTTSGFAESLRQNWLTSDVFVTATNKLKENKKITDETAESYRNFIDKIKDGKVSLKDWKQLENAGLATNDFKKALVQAGLSLGTLNDRFDKTLESGWLKPEVFKKATKALKEQDLVTDEAADAYSEFIKKVKNGSATLEDWRSLDEAGFATRELKDELIKAGTELGTLTDYEQTFISKTGNFNGVIRGISNIFRTLGKSFREAFPKANEKTLISIGTKLKELTDDFERSTRNFGYQLGPYLTDIFTAIHDVVGLVSDAFKGLFDILGGGGGESALHTLVVAMFSFTALLARGVSALVAFTKASSVFSKIKDFLIAINDVIFSILDRLIPMFDSGNVALSGLIDLFIPFNKELENSTSLVDTLLESVAAISSKVISGLEAGLSKISGLFSSVFKYIKDFLSNLGLDTVIDLLIGGSVLLAIEKFKGIISDLGDTFREVKEKIFGIVGGDGEGGKGGLFDGIASKIEGVLDSLSNSLNKFQETLNAAKLVIISHSLYELANACKTLSSLSKSQLTNSISAIAMLIVELSLAARKMKIGSTEGLITLVIALRILAEAVEELSGLPDVDSAVGAIGALLFEIALFMKLLSSKFVKTTAPRIAAIAKSLVVIGIALNLLAKPVRELGSMSLTSLAKGLGGVFGVLALMIGFLAAFNSKMFKGVGAKFNEISKSLITFGIALNILAAPIKSLGQLDSDDMVQGLFGIAGILVIVLAALDAYNSSVFKGADKNFKRLAQSLILLGIGLNLLVVPIAILGSLDPASMTNGLFGIAGALIILIGYCKAMDKVTSSAGKMLATSAALLIMSAAIGVIAYSVKEMSTIDAGPGLAILFGSLVILAGAMKAMQSSLAGAAAMVVVAGAMYVLAPAIVQLSSVNITGVLSGLLALGGVMAIFAGFSRLAPESAGELALFAGSMLVVAGVMAVLAPAIATISKLDLKGVGVGLLALGGAMAIFLVTAKLASGLIVEIYMLSSALAAFGVAVLALGVGLALVVASIGAAVFGIIKYGSDLVKALPVLAQALSAGFVAFIQGIGNSAESIKTAFVQIVDMIIEVFVEAIPKLVNAGYELLMNFLNGIASSTPNILDIVAIIVVTFVDGLASKLPVIIDAGFNLMISFLQGMADTIAEKGPMLLYAIEDIILAAVQAVAQVVPVFGDSAAKAIEGYREKIREKSGSVGSEAKNVADKASKNLEIKNQSKNADTAMNTLKDGIKRGERPTEIAAKAISKKIDSGLDIPSQYSNGTNSVQGLINGLNDMEDDAYWAGYAVGKASDQGIKDGSGVQSPSWKAFQTGTYIIQGLMNGMEAMSNKAASSASNVATSVIGSYNKALDWLNPFNGTISPTFDLTRVNGQLASIDASFSRVEDPLATTVDKLSKSLDSMTESMNSRSLNVYNTIDGTADPSAFADELVRNFRLNARTV